MARAAERREATREGILHAALRCFTRDGYRRTAMDRIAREAGISRAALYLHFDDKESLFRALVAGLYDDALEAAVDASEADATLAERIFGILKARSVRFFELLRTSEHADEFLDENHRLCGDLSTNASNRYAKLLAQALSEADRAREIDLAAAELRPASAADLLLDTADGIKLRSRTTMTPAEYVRRLERAVNVMVAGLAPRGRRR